MDVTKKVLCEECRKKVEYKVFEKEIVDILENREIRVIGEYAVCAECGEEVYVPELHEKNLEKYNKAL